MKRPALLLVAITMMLAAAYPVRCQPTPDPNDREMATLFAVYFFFTVCVTTFGDYRRIPQDVLDEVRAEPIPESQLKDEYIRGWYLRGPTGERVALNVKEPGAGCLVETNRVNPDRLHSLVAEWLQMISTRRSVPYRLVREKRYELHGIPTWQQSYFMAERGTPTVFIMVVSSERALTGIQALISYMFVSDPF